MMRLEYQPSPRLLYLLACLERKSGKLERFETAEGGDFDPVSALQLVGRDVDPTKVKAAHDSLESFSKETPVVLFRTLEQSSSSALRTINGDFLAPGIGGFDQDIVFPTVSAFLIGKRFRELLDWTTLELRRDNYPSSLVGGVFHLLFLQLSPFRRHNHLIALLCLERILLHSGYPFLRNCSLINEFQRHPINYYQSLRQAERTIFHTWQTLSVWLEFFTLCLERCAERRLHLLEDKCNYAKLPTTQQRVFDCIQHSGSMTREQISQKTGININTVKYSLKALMQQGFLIRTGAGRGTAYQSR